MYVIQSCNRLSRKQSFVQLSRADPIQALLISDGGGEWRCLKKADIPIDCSLTAQPSEDSPGAPLLAAERLFAAIVNRMNRFAVTQRTRAGPGSA
jgi:hypothetical protein